MECKICKKDLNSLKSLSSHLRRHKILSKEYYLLYLKKEGEGFCKNCGKETILYGINGYSIFCSNKCLYEYLSKNKEINNKRSLSMKETWEKNESKLNSKERNIKISKSLKNKKFSKERIKNLSISHIGQIPWNKNKRGCFSDETLKKMSNTQKLLRQDPNSYWNSSLFELEKEKIRNKCLNGHAIVMLKAQKNPSKPEVMLRDMVKELYPSCEFQFGILNYAIDVAIPEYKIAIEFDGWFHFDSEEHKQYHKLRQEKIEKEGWKFLRYTIFDKFPNIEKLKEDINRILK